MYGPPGTGKTLLARACAAQTDATFLKLAGPQLVQMFIGDGAKLVRDCFALAKEKAPAIIFIDELDAVGTKRFDSEKSGDREVQRTMLELLNQLDGFASDDRIKVIAATNRVDVLDPALLRSGRLDRKIEFPLPNEEARAQNLKIHSRMMTVDPAVNRGELARSTDEFGGAMLKAVCVEAGMIALRMGKNKIGHEHYVDAIAEVQAKKKDVSFLSLPNHSSRIRTDHCPSRRSTFMLKHREPGRIARGHGNGAFGAVHRVGHARLIERAVCVISWGHQRLLRTERDWFRGCPSTASRGLVPFPCFPHAHMNVFLLRCCCGIPYPRPWSPAVAPPARRRHAIYESSYSAPTSPNCTAQPLSYPQPPRWLSSSTVLTECLTIR